MSTEFTGLWILSTRRDRLRANPSDGKVQFVLLFILLYIWSYFVLVFFVNDLLYEIFSRLCHCMSTEPIDRMSCRYAVVTWSMCCTKTTRAGGLGDWSVGKRDISQHPMWLMKVREWEFHNQSTCMILSCLNPLAIQQYIDQMTSDTMYRCNL